MTQAPAVRGPCPYCDAAVPLATYTSVEHVIPQAFGRFKNNLIAWDVCDACNTFFGKALDRVLARGTYEGFFRFRPGGKKKPKDYRALSAADSRLRFEARTGPWTGMHLHQVLAKDGSALQVVPSKQLGFGASWDTLTYYVLDSLPTKQSLRERFPEGEMYVKGVGFESDDEVNEVLRTLGFDPPSEMTQDHTIIAEGASIRVEQIATIDRVVFRAVAKLAFNYLIGTFPQLSRMPQFREIRDYIRFDKDPSFRPVNARFAPVITNEPAGRRYEGHVFTLRHDPDSRATSASVALFNQVRYDVTFSPTGFLIGVPREFMTSGHFFETRTGEIHELAHGSRVTGFLVQP